MNRLFLTLSISIFLFFSCSDELDQEPFDGLTEDQLFSTNEGFTAAIKGVYSGFRRFGYYGTSVGLLSAPDILADNLIFNPQGRQTQKSLFEWRVTPVNEAFGMYESGYRIISRANKIIDNIDKLPEGDFRNNLYGEALAIRALVHFDIVRVYCKIPTQDVDAGMSLGISYIESFDPFIFRKRAGNTVNDVYTKIVNDLTEAVSKIGDDNGQGRLSKAAVHGILSRVFLHIGAYEKVVEHADKVIQMKIPVAPRNSFGKIWLDEYDESVLFKIRFVDKDRINIGVVYSQEGNEGIKSEYVVAYDFYQLFKSSDIRFSTTIQQSKFEKKLYNHVAKYLGRTTGNKNVVDAKYLRMAEVYLNKAEALAEMGNNAEALQALDEVRKNRYESFVSKGETGSLKDTIMLERRLELAFESDRFFTLKRKGLDINRSSVYGEFADGSGTVAVFTQLKKSDHRWQLPIPQGAIDSNPELEQNPGY